VLENTFSHSILDASSNGSRSSSLGTWRSIRRIAPSAAGN
jgi:hypothetical protein